MSSTLSRSTPPHRTSVVSGDGHTVNTTTPTPQKPDIRKQKAADDSPSRTEFALVDWAVGRKLSENYFPRAWYDLVPDAAARSVLQSRARTGFGVISFLLFCRSGRVSRKISGSHLSTSVSGNLLWCCYAEKRRDFNSCKMWSTSPSARRRTDQDQACVLNRCQAVC